MLRLSSYSFCEYVYALGFLVREIEYRSERADSLLEQAAALSKKISLCSYVPLPLAGQTLLYSIPFFRRHGTARASSTAPKNSALGQF